MKEFINKLINKTCLGTFSKTTDSSFIESSGIAGLDFIIIDTEHGFISHETLANHIRAAKSTDIKVVVRVESNNENLIAKALDLGADGVQIPNIKTSHNAKKAIEFAKFSPKGSRGVCRFVRDASFGNKKREDYFSQANKKLIILQIEGSQAIENLESILAVKNIDILFIGPYDLSQSLGVIGEVEHKKVKEKISYIVKKAKAKNIIIGAFADTIEQVKYLKNLGVNYIAYSVDINIYLDATKNLIKSL